MITERECPACGTELSDDALFCHRCGRSTPTGTSPAGGEPAPERRDFADAARLAAVQEALGGLYDVRRLLGRGGFAEVFVAFDKRLKREIAVKTIRSDLPVNHTLSERFQREAEAVAKLRHPNVVPIFSVGENRGVAYFTMPLIEGESLAAALGREGRISMPEAARILREAAMGLHAAHRVGIVHRDVKPDNIMLEGTERTVVVMDFGIAKKAGGEVDGLTGAGTVVGTPHYMSPEQAMGEQTLGPPSDQYALATVGYRMLTGRTPFDGSSLQSLLFKTVTEVPLPASEVSPDVPREASDVLAKALSKRPQDRFDSMADFATAFAQFEHPRIESGRARMDMAARIAKMRSFLPVMRRWILAAVLVCAVAVTLLVAATPRLPIMIAAQRDEAVSAARAFLKLRGVPDRASETARFVRNDTTFRFLNKHLGLAGIQRRPVTAAPVWEWKILSVAGWGTNKQSLWEVFLNRGSRVSGFRNVIPDDAAGARISIDSARSLAERELRLHGWSSSAFEQLPDSSINRRARTDVVFRWKNRHGSVPLPGGALAFDQVHVKVAGARVVEVQQTFEVPKPHGNPRIPEGVSMTMTLIALAALGIGVVTTLRRRSRDEVQWGSMLGLAAVVSLGLLIGESHGIYDLVLLGGGGEATIIILSLTAFFLLFGGFALWCLAVAAESLAYRRKPDVVAGLIDLSSGRLIIPEMVPAAARGYVFGAGMSLLTAFGAFVSLRLSVGVPILPDLPFSTPLRDVLLVSPLEAVLRGLIWLFIMAAFFNTQGRFQRVLFASLVAVAIVMPRIDQGLVTVLGTGILAYALWRYGVLTAIVATIVAGSIGTSVALLRVADSGYLLAAVASILVLATPGILATLSMRRFRFSSSESNAVSRVT